MEVGASSNLELGIWKLTPAVVKVASSVGGEKMCQLKDSDES